jgi:PPOX class probable FMN-dependent enzyme
MTDMTLEDLDQAYRKVHPLIAAKAMPKIDRHGRRFIELSPFCMIASAGPDGDVDVSPRGGEPGFVHVADDQTLMLPDRSGNNRLDTFRNLLAGPGKVGLIFMIPGVEEAYRVNGRAALRNEPELLQQFIEFGKPARSVLRITVDEAFLHCPKAIMRARLWEPDVRIDRALLPTGSEMFSDQMNLPKPTVSEAEIRADYATDL